jgi:hypothetical protein
MRHPMLLALGLAAAALTACAQGVPVHGLVLGSNESFSGETDSPADGDGNLTMISSRGGKCSGHYSHLTMASVKVIGTLDFTCDDGRRGSVVLAPGSDQLTGFGSIGKDVFVLGQ